jgi:SAM-dependent methyltransferase
MTSEGDPFPAFHARLEARHLADLTFAEVRRALQALSSLYVERRERMRGGTAFEGRGKRAAFALYYGPIHFLVVREVVRALGPRRTPRRILDLGCGTGGAGAAWALACDPVASVEGVDLNGWAVAEARWTLAQLGVGGRVHRGDVASTPMPRPPAGVLAAWTTNELEEGARALLLPRLLDAAHGGSAVLILEPLSRRVSPWWREWAEAVRAAGGRADEWHLPAPPLPKTLALLSKASTLDARHLTARSLSLGFQAPSSTPARSL